MNNLQNSSIKGDILIIDDSLPDLRVLSAMLTKHEYEVRGISEGSMALMAAEADPPDLILLDIRLPDMAGYDVCRKLKQDALTSDIPIIFISALDDVEDKVRSFAVGGVDYITKPFQVEEILARVEIQLTLQKLHQRLETQNNELECVNNELRREIAERQRIEEALQHAHDQLEQRVEQRTAELIRVNASLRAEITERRRVEQKVKQQTEQLRNLSARLAETEENERRLLAQELHDRVGQNLSVLDINLNIVRGQLPDEMGNLLYDSIDMVGQVAASVRNVMAELRAPMLDERGLVAALRWYGQQCATRADIEVIVQGEELQPRLPQTAEIAMFRIAQEALTNVIKHAQASQVLISVTGEADIVYLTIVDNGCGFEQEAEADHGWGLTIMEERARTAGGSCRVESRPGEGTRVIVDICRAII